MSTGHVPPPKKPATSTVARDVSRGAAATTRVSLQALSVVAGALFVIGVMCAGLTLVPWTVLLLITASWLVAAAVGVFATGGIARARALLGHSGMLSLGTQVATVGAACVLSWAAVDAVLEPKRSIAFTGGAICSTIFLCGAACAAIGAIVSGYRALRRPDSSYRFAGVREWHAGPGHGEHRSAGEDAGDTSGA